MEPSAQKNNSVVEMGDYDPLLEPKTMICAQLGKLADVPAENLIGLLEELRDKKKGDLAIHLAKLNKLKKLQGSPNAIAAEWAPKVIDPPCKLSSQIEYGDVLEKVDTSGPYLNFFIKKHPILKRTLQQVFKWKEQYGCTTQGKGETVIVEYRYSAT